MHHNNKKNIDIKIININFKIMPMNNNLIRIKQ